MLYSYQYNDQNHTVRFELASDGTYRVQVNDREVIVQAEMLSDGVWKLTVDGERHTVYTASEGNRRYVKVDGEPAHMLTIADQRTSTTRRRSGSAGGGSLAAQMPGQVVEVYVAEGEQVTSGQTLMVLEAMKMEIRVAAPHDGTVKQIMVKKGDVVQREQPLIEITATS